MGFHARKLIANTLRSKSEPEQKAPSSTRAYDRWPRPWRADIPVRSNEDQPGSAQIFNEVNSGERLGLPGSLLQVRALLRTRMSARQSFATPYKALGTL